MLWKWCVYWDLLLIVEPNYEYNKHDYTML
jgi:hypothetical protein